jgi:hypothetical protein
MLVDRTVKALKATMQIETYVENFIECLLMFVGIEETSDNGDVSE